MNIFAVFLYCVKCWKWEIQWDKIVRVLAVIFGRPYVKRFALCYWTLVLSCPVCPVCLSVTLVYCRQTVGWIKMKLGMQVALVLCHIVLDGDLAPLPKKGPELPQFSVCCGRMAEWIKMPLGMEVGLGPSDFVLDGDPAPPLQKGGAASPQFLAPAYSVHTAGRIKYATWYGGRPRPRWHYVRWVPSFPQKGHNFWPMSIVPKRLYVSAYHLVRR